MMDTLYELECQNKTLSNCLPQLRSRMDEFDRARGPLRDRQASIDSQLKQLSLRESVLRASQARPRGILGSLFSRANDSVLSEMRQLHSEATLLRDEWNALEKKASIRCNEEQEHSQQLEWTTDALSINDSKIRLLKKNIVRQCKEAARRRVNRNRKKERARQQAIVAAVEGEARAKASRIKRSLASQDGCAYCGGSLGDEPHADHIYPLSKGGLSVLENLVLVCGRCNIKKGTMTLVQFIHAHRLDRDAIEARLRVLGKDY
jgi:5-methylcytosine-specific restriction endonuclease McrA